MVKYQNSYLSVSGNTISISSIFRVVDEYCLHDNMTNFKITTIYPNTREKARVIICEKLYESFDHIQYHTDMSTLYSSVIACNKY